MGWKLSSLLTASILNLSTNTVVNSIPTGPNPRGIALTPDGKRAYVADWFSNTMDVIDVAAQKNRNTPVIVGANPWGIAMAPGGTAYVANFGDNTISVIDSSTNAVTATLPARSNPEDLTVSPTARPGILNYTFPPLDVPAQRTPDVWVFRRAGREIFDKVRSAGYKALALEGQIPEPHISLALADLVYFWNFTEAEAELRQGLAIDPNSAYAHEAYSWYYVIVGKTQDAVPESQKAMESEPMSPLASASLQCAYFYARDLR